MKMVLMMVVTVVSLVVVSLVSLGQAVPVVMSESEQEIGAACTAGTHAVGSEDCRPTWIVHWPQFQSLAFTLNDVNTLCTTMKEDIVTEVCAFAVKEVDCCVPGTFAGFNEEFTVDEVVNRIMGLKLFERMNDCLAVEIENCGFQRIVLDSVLQEGEIIYPNSTALDNVYDPTLGYESLVHLQRFTKAVTKSNRKFESLMRIVLEASKTSTDPRIQLDNAPSLRFKLLEIIAMVVGEYQSEVENIFLFGEKYGDTAAAAEGSKK